MSLAADVVAFDFYSHVKKLFYVRKNVIFKCKDSKYSSFFILKLIFFRKTEQEF